MSFKAGRKLITLDNYRKIYSVCSPDIQDEIRSAILDDTPIADYIDKCGEDSYKLGQIRMALRELVPSEYLDTRLTGKTVYNIRTCFRRGQDASSLLRYILDKSSAVTPANLEKISEFVCNGTVIDNVNFNKVRDDIIDVVLSGLYKGYPMWLITDCDVQLSSKVVKLLMRAMNLEIDIMPFLSGKWSEDELLMIFSYVGYMDVNKVLPYINEKFDADLLKEIFNIANKGADVRRLCRQDEDGYPIYNCYQVYEIGLAIINNCDTEEMYNPDLAPVEIERLRESCK